MIKFHLAAFIINLALILIVFYIFLYLQFLMMGNPLLNARPAIFDLLAYFGLIFSWLSTFSIYMMGNAKRHAYFFLGFNIAIFVIIECVDHMAYLKLNAAPFEWHYFYLTLADAMLEAIIPITIISLAVHFSQMILGKWLLPERYGRRPGGGADGLAA